MHEEAAIGAIEYLLERAYLVPVHKALDPLDPRDYATIEKRFAEALRGAVRGYEAGALQKAIKELDVDWRKLSPAQHEAAYRAANTALSKVTRQATMPALEIIDSRSRQIAVATRRSTKKLYKINIGVDLTTVDERILRHAAQSQAGFIRDEYGRRRAGFSKEARRIVAAGMQEGASSAAIAEKLDAVLTAKGIRRSKWYWDTVASNIANRSRSYASLASYKEYGIQRYLFEAVMDEVTTLQCRFFHGRSFEVEVALTKYAEVAAASDPEAVVRIQPWIRAGKDTSGVEQIYIPNPDGDRTVIADVARNAVGTSDDAGEFRRQMSDMELMARGVTVPPLHGGCRSRIIPDFA